MVDRQKLVKQLKVHEGVRLKPYVDSVGKLTIGIGHNLTDRGLTIRQVELILDDDIADAVAFAERFLPFYSGLDEVRQRAIVDMVFNLGSKLLQFKATLAALSAKDWESAANHMLDSLWARQVGTRAETLAEMIRTGHDVA
jgi:lysozyme